MPKLKTNRGAAKRFTRTGSGKIKRNASHRRHILTKKAPGRKRALGKAVQTAPLGANTAHRLPVKRLKKAFALSSIIGDR